MSLLIARCTMRGVDALHVDFLMLFKHALRKRSQISCITLHYASPRPLNKYVSVRNMCPEVLPRTHCACHVRGDKTSMPAGVGFLNWTLQRRGLDLDPILDGSCYDIFFLAPF